jgi:hypothetical protein
LRRCEKRAEAQRLATEFLAARARMDELPRRRIEYNPRTGLTVLGELHHKSAVLFGESRGWTLSKSAFGYRTLARLGKRSDYDYEPPGCDHSWFYRQHGGYAVAIATHPYKARV